MKAEPFDDFRWACKDHGCFNDKKRLMFDRIYEKLGRLTGFSDLDAVSERNGVLFLMEWKGQRWNIGRDKGSHAMHYLMTKMARQGHLCVCVCGDAATMRVDQLMTYTPKGTVRDWSLANFDDLCDIIREWKERADKTRAIDRIIPQLRYMTPAEFEEFAQHVMAERERRARNTW